MNENTIDTILLFDSDTSIDELKKIIQEHANSIVISFDYDAYKKLIKNKINCIISDSYLEKIDFELIQKKSYLFSNWAQNKIVEKLLTYENINLADLYYRDNIYYFVPLIKKFLEIKKIVQKFPNVKFFAPPELFNFISIFSNNVKQFSSSSSNSLEFVSDSIKYNLNVKGIFLPITLSKKTFNKLKSITEKFIHLFFGLNKDTKNNVALLEFHTIKFKKFFKSASKSDTNLILFNRRRPSVWNLPSFLSVKKSDCHVFSPSDVVLDNEKIQKSIIDFNKKISELENEDTLFDFFTIDDQSLWLLFQKNFLKHCRDRIHEAIFEIELIKEFLKYYKLKAIILFHESGFNEQIFIHLAKKFKIKIFVLTHGLGLENFNDSYLDMLKFNRVIGDVKFDKLLVWGKTQELFYKTCGVPASQIEIVGASIYDEYFLKSTVNLPSEYILLATSPSIRHTVNLLTVEHREKYEFAIRQIAKTIKNLNKKLLIKLHPFQEQLDYEKILGDLKNEVIIIKQGEILPLIEKCEFLITMDVSTTILEAEICNKPVITFSAKDAGFGEAEIFRQKKSLYADIDSIDSILKKIITDSSFKDELIENSSTFLNDYISFQGQGSKKLLDFLDSI